MRYPDDDILSLIIDFHTGNCGKEDKQRLEEWVTADIDNEKTFCRLLSVLNNISLAQRTPTARNVKDAMKGRNGRPRRRLRIGWAAASVLLVAGLGLIGYHNYQQRNASLPIARMVNNAILILPDGSQIALDSSTDNCHIAEQGDVTITHRNGQLVTEKRTADASPAPAGLRWGTLEVPRGVRFDMLLEDGTRVWLNAGSRLRFPVAFAEGERRVQLEGEAYFAVAADAGKPFVVETAGQNLTVLGTEFNVYAYEGESNTCTTLIEGSLRLDAKEGGAPVVLHPGEQAQLPQGAKSYNVHRVDTDEITAWRSGMFVFDNNTLEVVMNKLSRWYDFEYAFEDGEAARLEVMGNIYAYDDLNSVLEVMNMSGQVTIRQTGNLIKIGVNK